MDEPAQRKKMSERRHAELSEFASQITINRKYWYSRVLANIWLFTVFLLEAANITYSDC